MKIFILIAAICITKASGSDGWGHQIAYVIPQQVQGGWGWNAPHHASLLQHHHQYQLVQQPQIIVGGSSGWAHTPQVVQYSQPANAIGGWRGGYSPYGAGYPLTYGGAGWGGASKLIQHVPTAVSYQVVHTGHGISGGWRR